MERALLLNPEMNDLVFEGRNKAYGAFVLRQDYEGNMVRGMIAGLLFFVLCISSPLAYYYFKSDAMPEEIIYDIKEIILENVKTTPAVIKPVVASNPAPPPPKSQIKFVPPVVVPDDEEVPEDLPPAVDDLKNKVIGTVTTENENGTVGNELPIETPGTGTGIVNVPAPEPEVFNSYAVEQQPEFPGGLEAMYRFIKKNLLYTSFAKENNITGTVIIQFVISKEGKIENAKIVRKIGGGLDQEALKVVNLMPVWKPGKHNGKPVAVNFTLPIKFEFLK